MNSKIIYYKWCDWEANCLKNSGDVAISKEAKF